MLNSQKMGTYNYGIQKNTLYCSEDYNLAQKLDNSVQIIKITGHA